MIRLILLLVLALTLPGFAAAECPKGTNVKLNDTTTTSTVNQQAAAQTASTTGGQASGSMQGVVNHWPH